MYHKENGDIACRIIESKWKRTEDFTGILTSQVKVYARDIFILSLI